MLMTGRLAAASTNVDAIKTAVFLKDSTLMKSFLDTCIVFKKIIKQFLKSIYHSTTIY